MAYRELVERHQGVAVRTAHLITGSDADAQEAAQDAFVKAYYALDTFRADSSFRTWLLRIVANEARNRLRSAGRTAAMVARWSLQPGHADWVPSAESTVLGEHRRRELLRMVNELSEDDRLVIACRFFLELSQAETASVLGWRVGTVKSRLSRAIRRLRSAFEAKGYRAMVLTDGMEASYE